MRRRHQESARQQKAEGYRIERALVDCVAPPLEGGGPLEGGRRNPSVSSSRFSVAKGVCLFRPAGSTSRPYCARTYFSRFAGGSPSAAAAAPAAGGGRFCVQVARLHTDRDAKLSSPHPPAAQIQSPTPNDAFCCGCAAAAAADSAGCACSHPCPVGRLGGVGWGWVGSGCWVVVGWVHVCCGGTAQNWVASAGAST